MGKGEYSVSEGAQLALEKLLGDEALPVPQEVRKLVKRVKFVASSSQGDQVVLPCPFKEAEAISALKAVEGSVASALSHLRWDLTQDVQVDMQRSLGFLLMAYLASVDGMTKADKTVRDRLKDTDLFAAQSDPYRRMSANLYETKDGKYFHIHGSLEATTTLNMIGLPGFDPQMKDYHEIIERISSHVKKFTADELEQMNAKHRQAGVTALKHSEFLESEHGRKLNAEPLWRIAPVEEQTPPVPFSGDGPTKNVLAGIKVIDLSRIIAGPTITRVLAEYGADVIKVTSPNLPDVPFFQVDGNVGKHTTDLDLRTTEGREAFEKLLEEADVVVDGYRPGSIARLGYGTQQLSEIAKSRGKGFVYVNENCFGNDGPWSHRPGWQQIADCVSGIAWAQGEALGKTEPVIPPFPMSDYGTGCMGAIAAMTGLYHRATKGGSYHGSVSLVQYDLFLFRLGLYPQELWQSIIKRHDPELLKLRHFDSVDVVSQTALKSMKRIAPSLWGDDVREEHYSPGFKGNVRVVRPVVSLSESKNQFRFFSRPNGFDAPVWPTGADELHLNGDTDSSTV